MKKKCKFCGKPFEPVTKWQEYCQKKCRVAANNRKMTNLLRRAKKAGLELEEPKIREFTKGFKIKVK